MANFTVNFTMLARDRFRLTQQSLRSLGEQRWVTIMDDRSEPLTRDYLRYWGALTNSFVARNDEAKGTGPLRNDVIRISEAAFGRGAYLVLSDNDTYFNPRFLEIMHSAYKKARECGFLVLGGYNHPFNRAIDNSPRVQVGETEVYPVHVLATQSMMMEWDVWDRFGPFCQTPIDRVCQSEDVEFSNRITAAGYKVGVVSPHLVYGTGITNTFGEKIPGWELVKAQCPEGIICE